MALRGDSVFESKRLISQTIGKHQKTLVELKEQENALRFSHRVPKDVEMTPVLQKMILVN